MLQKPWGDSLSSDPKFEWSEILREENNGFHKTVTALLLIASLVYAMYKIKISGIKLYIHNYI